MNNCLSKKGFLSGEVRISTVSDNFLDGFSSLLLTKSMNKIQFSPTARTPQDDAHLRNMFNIIEETNEFLNAAETGNYRALQNLIRKGVDVQQIDSLGRNALHLAVTNGSEQSILVLLKAKVDPNVRDNVGCTPLSLCLLRSPSLKIAKLLLEHGAAVSMRYSPNDAGLFLNFVMMSVPTKEELAIMRLLVLSYNALLEDVNAPGGRQALHYAAMSNNCELITFLAELGADLHVTNHRNQTPKKVAAAFNCKEAEFILQSLEYNSLLATTSIRKSRNRPTLLKS